ncbi:hypothetical protein ACFY41_18505 [Streptomyces syringium]|uniref:hypothetical protein n=1 Tax=Streptomyces syringium TaxID=76729 RepID=UPI0036BDEE20
MNTYAHVPAARWLVSRETHPSVAKEAWARDEPAMLRTGIHFEAVRLSADLVHHIARSTDRDAVERAFATAGIDSAVVVDPSRRWYYALVPPGTAEHWAEPTAACLGPDCYLGVPAAHRADPPGTHWLLTPPDGEAALCDPGDVRRLMAEGRNGAPEGRPRRHNGLFSQGR